MQAVCIGKKIYLSWFLALSYITRYRLCTILKRSVCRPFFQSLRIRGFKWRFMEKADTEKKVYSDDFLRGKMRFDIYLRVRFFSMRAIE